MLIKIARVLALVYVLFGFYLFFAQKSILYHPDNQDFKNCKGFEEYKKLDHNGTRFYFKKGSNEEAVIYYHGNAGSACDRSDLKSIFEKTDASLYFVEYSGYSGDKAKPSRKLILKDVENIHYYVNKKNHDKISVYGQSIGSGAASYHARLGNVDNLILTSSFSELSKVAQSKYVIYPASLLLTEEFNNAKWLNEYQGRLLVIHGDSDYIIPHKHSRELYESLQTPAKEYVLIEARGHNDIWLSGKFRDKVINFISSKRVSE
ncbi:MAG: alpha/beta hydrolase [Candidatus Moranbacteria bacterium]|nr:alpha/beta hydrolase [Candidatus Moranbacteria bacterium]